MNQDGLTDKSVDEGEAKNLSKPTASGTVGAATSVFVSTVTGIGVGLSDIVGFEGVGLTSSVNTVSILIGFVGVETGCFCTGGTVTSISTATFLIGGNLVFSSVIGLLEVVTLTTVDSLESFFKRSKALRRDCSRSSTSPPSSLPLPNGPPPLK